MSFFNAIKLRFAVWVWHHTPNCSEMSRLASRSLDESLPLKLRVQMRLHHLICIWCKRYFRQLSYLHQAAPQLELKLPEPSGRSLSPEAQRRIVQQLIATGGFSSVRTGG